MDIDTLVEALENTTTEILIDLWNEYCDRNHYEERIWVNDEEFIQMAFQGDVVKALKATAEEYNYEDPYAWFDDFGSLRSCEDPVESPIYLSDLAEWLLKNKDTEELIMILNMWEEDDEYEDE